METATIPMPPLTPADLTIVALMIGGMFLVGTFAGREERSTDDFFLGGRRIPWWAACLSFVATEISALTIISVPATAYRENWQYAQLFIGSALSRLAIAFLFIPAFYRFECTTIYDFLKFRFGQATQISATLFFFFTRLLGSAVRLYAACMAVSILLGWGLVPTLGAFTVVSILYIAYGGIKAVVWANVVQAIAFLGGGLASLAFLASQADGGLFGMLSTAAAHGKTSVLNWGPGLFSGKFVHSLFTDPNVIYIAVANGFVGSLAAFGTDHDMMQRLLTVETRRESQQTMLLTILGSFAVLCIYLSIGAGIFTYYLQHPGPLGMADKLDGVFPNFIGREMPSLLRGLMLAAIVLASIDSPLGSLAATFVNDIYRPVLVRGRKDDHYLLVSRIAVVVFGLLLAVLAFACSYVDKLLWLAFKIGGVTFGSLLGVFLLGLTTQRAANRANVIAMFASAGLMALLLFLSERGIVPLGWTWLVILGTASTFSIAWFLGPRLDPELSQAAAGDSK